MTEMKNLPPHILNLHRRVQEAEQEYEERRAEYDNAVHKLWSWRKAECDKSGHKWKPDGKWDALSICEHCGEQKLHACYEMKRR